MKPGRFCTKPDNNAWRRIRPLLIAAAPVQARGHAGEAAEHSRHVLLMRKAALKRDVCEALLVFAKQYLGAFDPAVQHILVGRDPQRRLEQAHEIFGRETADVRHRVQPDIGLQFRFHKITATAALPARATALGAPPPPPARRGGWEKNKQ